MGHRLGQVGRGLVPLVTRPSFLIVCRFTLRSREVTLREPACSLSVMPGYSWVHGCSPWSVFWPGVFPPVRRGNRPWRTPVPLVILDHFL